MTAQVPEKNLLGILTPNSVQRALVGAAEVSRSLSAPIGSKKLSEIVKPGEKIAIVTSAIP